MKASFFFVFLSVAVLMRAAAAPLEIQQGTPDCGIYRLPFCTREQIPVCGSNGKTYSNVCMLCLENKEQSLNTYIASVGSC